MRKGKGKDAKLVFMAHCADGHRHGLVSDFRLTEANGTAERDAALYMLIWIPGSRRLSVGTDRGYDTRDFVAECRDLSITPHVAQRKRWSALDWWTTRHEAYRSIRKAPKTVSRSTVEGFCRSPLCGFGADLTMWGVGGDGVQPGEDVEVDSAGRRARFLSPGSLPWPRRATQTPVGALRTVDEAVSV